MDAADQLVSFTQNFLHCHYTLTYTISIGSSNVAQPHLTKMAERVSRFFHSHSLIVRLKCTTFVLLVNCMDSLFRFFIFNKTPMIYNHLFLFYYLVMKML